MIQEDVDMLEKTVGWSLPDSYKMCLLSGFNGLGKYTEDGICVAISTFYTDLHSGDRGLLPEWKFFRVGKGKYLPIAFGMGGDRILLGRDGQIYRWSHETNKISLLIGSFAQLRDKLAASYSAEEDF